MLFWWSIDLTELKHKSYFLSRCGLNSTAAALHGDVMGRCKVLSCNKALLPKIAINLAKVFSLKKVQVAACRILSILLVSLAYDSMF